jgi:hypothetical protein
VAERLDTDVLLASWTRAMRARNLSHKTISGYVESAGQLTAFAAERGADPLDRRTIEEFLAHLSNTRAPATVSVRYRALQQWTRWLADEDELPADPMAKMPPPQVPEQPVELVTEDEMRRLLTSCKGKDYVSRRDHAIFIARRQPLIQPRIPPLSRRRMWAILLLTVAVTACASSGAAPGGGTALPTHTEEALEASATDGTLSGELGCLWLENDEGPKVPLVFPAGYETTANDDGVVLLDEDDNEVASVGDRVEVGGNDDRTGQYLSCMESSEFLDHPWLVSSVARCEGDDC